MFYDNYNVWGVFRAGRRPVLFWLHYFRSDKDCAVRKALLFLNSIMVSNENKIQRMCKLYHVFPPTWPFSAPAQFDAKKKKEKQGAGFLDQIPAEILFCEQQKQTHPSKHLPWNTDRDLPGCISPSTFPIRRVILFTSLSPAPSSCGLMSTEKPMASSTLRGVWLN